MEKCTNSLGLLALWNNAHSRVGSLLVLYFAIEPLIILPKFWINTEEQLSVANNLTSWFWPLTMSSIWHCIFLKVMYPCLVSWIGLLQMNRMNMSLWVDLHFLLHEESLCGTPLNVLEVISKQEIHFLKQNLNRRKSKILGGFWECCELLFELLFWLIAKVMALKKASAHPCLW